MELHSRKRPQAGGGGTVEVRCHSVKLCSKTISYSKQRRVTMTIAQSLLAEFETQAPITRRFLERLPEEKLTWKPHEKSMSAGQLAYHLAFIPGGVVRFVQNNLAQAPDFANFPQPASRQEILKTFDESITTVRDLLPKLDDSRMN